MKIWRVSEYLTKYLQDEEVEEVNINAWNCIEVIYPDKVEIVGGNICFSG